MICNKKILYCCNDMLIFFIITKNSIYDADHFFSNMPHNIAKELS